MHRIYAVPVLMALLAAGGCKELTVPDFNNPSLEDLQNNPNRVTIGQAAQGLLIGTRELMGDQNGYVSLLGILGRESYNFDPADPRFITEMLIGPLDRGSPAFGANLFEEHYQNIRNANLVLAAVDQVSGDLVTGLTDTEKEAARGFAKTIQALDYLHVINSRDEFGAPIEVNIDPVGDPAPIATKAEVFATIERLLDEGLVHLQAGGDAFSFALGPGFVGFDTPPTFATVNRALKARVDVYTGDFAGALEALAGSFVNTAAPLELGVYHAFSTVSGDDQNTLFDPTGRAILAHPSIVTDAQLQPNGSPDARLGRKVAPLGEVREVQDITTDVLFTIYQSNTAPIPIIRNEELILLRAEANIGLGNLAGAQEDINFVRAASGGLAPVTLSDPSAALNELLYNKRYSLLFEGGHRWIDMRRYGLLNTLPLALPSHTIQPAFPFPEAECLARGNPDVPGC